MIVSEGTCHRMRIPASSVQGITAGGGGVLGLELELTKLLIMSKEYCYMYIYIIYTLHMIYILLHISRIYITQDQRIMPWAEGSGLV